MPTEKFRGVQRCGRCGGEIEIYGAALPGALCCGRPMFFVPADEITRERDFLDQAEDEGRFLGGAL